MKDKVHIHQSCRHAVTRYTFIYVQCTCICGLGTHIVHSTHICTHVHLIADENLTYMFNTHSDGVIHLHAHTYTISYRYQPSPTSVTLPWSLATGTSLKRSLGTSLTRKLYSPSTHSLSSRSLTTPKPYKRCPDRLLLSHHLSPFSRRYLSSTHTWISQAVCI